MNRSYIYLDNMAATRLDERVLEAMRPYLFDTYAVATSQFGYSLGIAARDGLEEARESVAESLAASPDEIVFTSGSAESSNMAIKGVAAALATKRGRHVITTAIEDFPVLQSMRALERAGLKLTLLPVDAHGRVHPDRMAQALRGDTALVSIQAANQEIGTLQDIATLGTLAREAGALVHVDATYAWPRVPLDVSVLPVDLVSLTTALVHGPRGTGALYVREGTPMAKWMDGGFQEGNRRGGPEDIAGAVGMAAALGLVTREETHSLQELRDRLESALLEIPSSVLNGHPELRAPTLSNVSFRFVEGESVLLHLDMRGIAVSTGSACFSRSLEASHVILGIGGNHERAHGSVRMSLGRYNRPQDIDATVSALTDIVARLREISPLGKEVRNAAALQ
jgi:cysteine desulfurase